MERSRVTVSIVSHGQNALVNALLRDLERRCRPDVVLVITENIPDCIALELGSLADVTTTIANSRVKGFGANHNAAFARCTTPFFCVLNPDVRLESNPFPPLLARIERSGAGVVGPLVRDSSGAIQDSARRYPSFARLARRLGSHAHGPDYAADQGALEVDWIAGMFMLFPAEVYRSLHGFDERYFLYYEDADLCRRIRRRGMPVIYDPAVSIVHDARRGSRRNLRLAAHHVASIARFMRSG